MATMHSGCHECLSPWLHVALHPFTNLHVAACAFQNAKSTGDNGLGTTNLIIIIIIAIILPVIIIGTYH